MSNTNNPNEFSNIGGGTGVGEGQGANYGATTGTGAAHIGGATAGSDTGALQGETGAAGVGGTTGGIESMHSGTVPTGTTTTNTTSSRPGGGALHHGAQKDPSLHPHPHAHDPYLSRHDGINNDANYSSTNSFRSQGGDGVNSDQNFTPDELYQRRGGYNTSAWEGSGRGGDRVGEEAYGVGDKTRVRDGFSGRGVDGYGDLGTPPRSDSPYAREQRGDGFNSRGVDGFGDLGTPPRSASPYGQGQGQGRKERHHDVAEGEGQHRKPTLGQKIIGTADEVIGKITHNPAKVQHGHDLKTGTAGTTGTSNTSTGSNA